LLQLICLAQLDPMQQQLWLVQHHPLDRSTTLMKIPKPLYQLGEAQ
jgi:hypothetical protein